MSNEDKDGDVFEAAVAEMKPEATAVNNDEQQPSADNDEEQQQPSATLATTADSVAPTEHSTTTVPLVEDETNVAASDTASPDIRVPVNEDDNDCDTDGDNAAVVKVEDDPLVVEPDATNAAERPKEIPTNKSKEEKSSLAPDEAICREEDAMKVAIKSSTPSKEEESLDVTATTQQENETQQATTVEQLEGTTTSQQNATEDQIESKDLNATNASPSPVVIAQEEQKEDDESEEEESEEDEDEDASCSLHGGGGGSAASQENVAPQQPISTFETVDEDQDEHVGGNSQAPAEASAEEATAATVAPNAAEISAREATTTAVNETVETTADKQPNEESNEEQNTKGSAVQESHGKENESDNAASLTATCAPTDVPKPFVNEGLLRWEAARQVWLSHHHKQKQDDNNDEDDSSLSCKPAAPAIPLDVDEIIDVIFASPRQWRMDAGGPRRFPQPVPLPQLVDLLQDLWEAEGIDP